MGASYIPVALLVPTGCGGSVPDATEPAESTQVMVKEAESYERARRYDLARERYERAVAEAPEAHSGAFAAHRFASALAFWGELEAAAKRLEQSVSLDSARASAWHDLGVIRAKLGRVREAETALRRAVTLVPRDPRPRVALAALLVKTRQLDAARREYQTLLELEIPKRTRQAIEKALDIIDRTNPLK